MIRFMCTELVFTATKQFAAYLSMSPPLQVEDIRMTMLESEAMLTNLAKLLHHGGGRMLSRNYLARTHAPSFYCQIACWSHHINDVLKYKLYVLHAPHVFLSC